MFLSSGQKNFLIITFEKLVLVSTIVVFQKRKRDTKQTFKKTKLTETNSVGATNKFYYSCHKSYKPAASQSPTASPCSPCIVLSMWSMRLLSQHNKEEGFCSAQMFSLSCCSLRRKQPHSGAKYENSCWFCVLIVCAHVSAEVVITHSGWKGWRKEAWPPQNITRGPYKPHKASLLYQNTFNAMFSLLYVTAMDFVQHVINYRLHHPNWYPTPHLRPCGCGTSCLGSENTRWSCEGGCFWRKRAGKHIHIQSYTGKKKSLAGCWLAEERQLDTLTWCWLDTAEGAGLKANWAVRLLKHVV